MEKERPKKYEVGERVKCTGWGGTTDFGKIIAIDWVYHNRLFEWTWGYIINWENEGPGFAMQFIPEGYLQKVIMEKIVKELFEELKKVKTFRELVYILEKKEKKEEKEVKNFLDLLESVEKMGITASDLLNGEDGKGGKGGIDPSSKVLQVLPESSILDFSKIGSFDFKMWNEFRIIFINFDDTEEMPNHILESLKRYGKNNVAVILEAISIIGIQATDLMYNLEMIINGHYQEDRLEDKNYASSIVSNVNEDAKDIQEFLNNPREYVKKYYC